MTETLIPQPPAPPAPPAQKGWLRRHPVWAAIITASTLGAVVAGVSSGEDETASPDPVPVTTTAPPETTTSEAPTTTLAVEDQLHDEFLNYWQALDTMTDMEAGVAALDLMDKLATSTNPAISGPATDARDAFNEALAGEITADEMSTRVQQDFTALAFEILTPAELTS